MERHNQEAKYVYINALVWRKTTGEYTWNASTTKVGKHNKDYFVVSQKGDLEDGAGIGRQRLFLTLHWQNGKSVKWILRYIGR